MAYQIIYLNIITEQLILTIRFAYAYPRLLLLGGPLWIIVSSTGYVVFPKVVKEQWKSCAGVMTTVMLQ